MEIRKIYRKALLAVCAAACLAAPGSLRVAHAEKGGNEAAYTYTITLYAGKEGTIHGQSQVEITGKAYGEQVNLGDYLTQVTLKDAAKYYVKGIRESGKDNSTAVSNPAFSVESDREYVVAYGIRGNMTTYTVNYQDTSGNALLPSATFDGAVGDRAVVAYRYVDGYRPQAYNLTKTLSSNAAENVLTFVYTKLGSGSGGSSTETDTVINNTTTDGTDNTDKTTDRTTTRKHSSGKHRTEEEEETADTSVIDASAGESDAGAGAGGNTASRPKTKTQEQTEENTEEETQDLVDLDDGEVPLFNTELAKKIMGNLWFLAPVLCAAIVALILFLLFRKKKKDKEEDSEQQDE